jgi:hypothetical protein
MTYRRFSAAPAGLLLVLLALLAQAVLGPSSASAQVVVLRVDPGAEALCAAFEASLSDLDLIADPGYLAEAQRRELDPHGEQTLLELTPPAHARLAVVPQAATADAATVDFRDGRSGEGLGTVSIPLEGGVLGAAGREMLRREVTQRLGGRPAAAAQSARDHSQTVVPAKGGDEERSNDSNLPELLVRAFAGIGVGTRNVNWPLHGEQASLATGAFAALELGASFAVAWSEAFSLGPELVYQTSLDDHVTETHIAGASQRLKLRAHRFEAVLAPTFRFGSRHGWSIAPAVGYGVRDLQPGVHQLLTPSYSLTGPLFRLTLRIPFGERLALRLGPEAQWLHVGKALRDLGVDSQGVSVGGDAAFELRVAQGIVIELTYREAHALLPSSQGSAAIDVERFATARLVGVL